MRTVEPAPTGPPDTIRRGGLELSFARVDQSITWRVADQDGALMAAGAIPLTIENPAAEARRRGIAAMRQTETGAVNLRRLADRMKA